ncbi:MAG: transglycosylase SLT domain-containing protein [Pyrinomonadaceae bacterium]
MARYLISLSIIAAVVAVSGYFFFRDYWEHRYDELIIRHARVFNLDERIVWSLIYEETWFQGWKIGAADEVGLMQVTPTVGREWAKETGLSEFEKRAAEDPVAFLSDAEQNIQVGCWYLEKVRERYRGRPAETAMMLAAYNAGPSRVEEWTRGAEPRELSESDFVARIAISSTKAYVTSILDRYRDTEALRPGPEPPR